MSSFGLQIVTIHRKVVDTLTIGLTLSKSMITIPVAASGLIGTLLAEPDFSILHVKATLSIWLMASASSCINQLQERKYDALMPRTKRRPLVRKRISVSATVLLIVLLAISSLMLVVEQLNGISFALLVGTLFWYNLVYTPLKRITPFAVIPGAITGMTPPLIGYSLISGGSLKSEPLVFLSLFFFLGQIPHFWLLLLRYHKEYKQAGFAVLSDHLDDCQLKRISLWWGIVAFGSAFLLFCSEIYNSEYTFFCMMLFTTALAFFYAWFWNQHKRQFFVLNCLYSLVMLSVLIDRMLF